MNLKKIDILFNYELDKKFKNKKDSQNINNYQEFIDEFIAQHLYHKAENNYQLLELILFEIYHFKMWITDTDKLILIKYILNKFNFFLKEESYFKQFLILIQMIFTRQNEIYFQENKCVLDFLYNTITTTKRAELTIQKFQKILKNNYIPDLALFIVKITEKIYDKNKAIEKAKQYKNYPNVCDYLLDNYKNNPIKLNELLHEIIKQSQK